MTAFPRAMVALALCLAFIVGCTATRLANERLDEVSRQINESVDEAWAAYGSGEVTAVERDAMIADAQRLARAELAEIPKEVAAAVERDKEAGVSYAMTTIQLLLMAFGLGGAGVTVGIAAGKRQKPPTPPDL